MAIRWLYITDHPTGTKYCDRGYTVDDTNVALPDSKNKADRWTYAWTADDPSYEPPATADAQPLKRYNVAQNKIYLCNQAQIAAYNLRQAKIDLNEQVDRKTLRLFNQGLSYDGEVFPLQLDDSVNYQILHDNRNNSNVVTWPKDIITRDRKLYTITNAAACESFFEATAARIFYIVDGARDLKNDIRNAADMAALDAIIDAR